MGEDRSEHRTRFVGHHRVDSALSISLDVSLTHLNLFAEILLPLLLLRVFLLLLPPPPYPSIHTMAVAQLSPVGILISMMCLLGVASTLFFFAPTDNMKNDSTHTTKTLNVVSKFWGTVTAEIDWCEYNHRTSDYVAEPENTYSSLLYSFLGIVVFVLHRPIIRKDPSYRAIILLHNLNFIGIGSTLFHASLQYWLQLYDELPMLYFIVTAAWILWQRKIKSPTAFAKSVAYFLVAFSVALTFLSTQYDQHDYVHQSGRGIATVVFCTSLIYVFVSASIAVSEVEKTGGKTQAQEMSHVFKLAFVSIVCALVSWISDNLFCSRLQNLPYSIPYINLHAYGWHVGTALAVYFLIVACTIQRCVVLGIDAEVTYGWGFWPFVTEKKSTSTANKKVR